MPNEHNNEFDVLQRVRDGYVSGKHTTDCYISDAVFDEAFNMADERGLSDLQRVELCAEVDNSIYDFITGGRCDNTDPEVGLQNYEDDSEPSVDFIVKNILDKMLAGEQYHA